MDRPENRRTSDWFEVLQDKNRRKSGVAYY